MSANRLAKLSRAWAVLRQEVAVWRACPARKPLLRQLAEAVRLGWQHRCWPYHYLTFGLYDAARKDDPAQFVSPKVINRYQRQLNPLGTPSMKAANDKLETFLRLSGAGVATVPVLAVTAPGGRITAPDGSALDPAALAALIAQAEGRVFVKPRGGAHGHGVAIVTDPADLQAQAAGPAALVVQPVLRQHPGIARLHPASLNTVRIDTYRKGGVLQSSAAVLKVGRAGSLVDNGGAGGIFVPIDLETGRFGPRGRSRGRMGALALEHHPDTGAVFSGTVPFWAELKAEIARGAAAMPDLGTIGWDVALTEEGPMIVEANAFWIATLLQIAGRGLGETPFGRDALAHHLGRKPA